MSDESRAKRILQAALEYAGHDWKVVPLRGRGKVPWLGKWQELASDDEDQIGDWWGQQQHSNVGIQLGPRSWIVDFEGDDEQSAADLRKLFDGEVPLGPVFKASRGEHRLFRYRKDLPAVACLHIGAVELRIGGGDKGAQTVFPPSIHPSGIEYQWLPGLSPGEIDVPEIPDIVVARIWNYQREKPGAETTVEGRDWKRIGAGVAEGSRNESAAAWIGSHLANQVDVFSDGAVDRLWLAMTGWNRTNTPPLDGTELHRTFSSILARERRKRTASHDGLARDPITYDDSGEAVIEGWRLENTNGEPRLFFLYGTYWDGSVRLTSDEYASFGRMRVQCIEQKKVWLPPAFRKMWEGGSIGSGDKKRWQDPLAAALLEKSQTLAVSAEAKRTSVVATRVLDKISQPRVIEEGAEPSTRSGAGLLPDGRVVFKFTWMLDSLAKCSDKIERGELVSVLQSVGAGEYRVGVVRSRLHTLTSEGLSMLRSLSLQPDGGAISEEKGGRTI